MLDLPTVVKNVAIDSSLAPVDVRVFLVASQQLDDLKFQPVKLLSVALPIGLGKSRVHASMRRLCEQGYLERGPRAAHRGPVTYRLPPRLIALR